MKPNIFEYLKQKRMDRGLIKEDKIERTIKNANKMLSGKLTTDKNG